MPRKTKETNELKKETKKATTTTKKAATEKKADTKKATKTTKTTAKKTAATTKKASTTKKTATEKKTDTKKATKTTKPATKKTAATTKKASTSTKKAVAEKKADTKKATKTTKTATKKTAATTKKASTTTKKAATKKKADTKKTTKTTKTTKKPSVKKVEIVEYYDLPYRYNQTIVKLLAQTPTTLFVYWDISDEDRKNFINNYGDGFFENTKPVLIIHNKTLNYSFEVEINDFANSWYLHVSDSKCEYKIELGRRPFDKSQFNNEDYFYISNSNELESPNDRILFDSIGDRVFFRDVKTGIESEKSIYNLSLLRNMGRIYNIYDLYKAIYSNENVEDIYDLYNPSSSSSF